MNFLRSFLDNNSVFGQLMTRCGIIIAANILFVLCSIPMVTAGAAWAALYTVMLKTLYRDPELNPFRTFLEGLRENWKQGTAVWLIGLALAVLLYLEHFWVSQAEGVIGLLRYPLLGLGLILAVLVCYLFPTMATFRATLPQLLKNCVYFAVKRPVTLVLVLLAHMVPLGLTWLDRANLPLYAFLWCTFGFAAVAMFSSSLLLKLYRPYLQRMEPEEETPSAPEAPSEAQVLEEMEKLGM